MDGFFVELVKASRILTKEKVEGWVKGVAPVR